MRALRNPAAWAVLLAAALSACGGTDSNDQGGGKTACELTPVPAELLVAPPEYCEVLSSTFEAKDRMGQSVTTFLPGELITLEASVTNHGAEPVTITASSGCPQVSFRVLDDAHALAWDSQQGMACTQALVDLTYAPGETRVFTSSWDQTVCDAQQAPSGQYKAELRDSTPCRPVLNRSLQLSLQ